jgi:hypothetical protein
MLIKVSTFGPLNVAIRQITDPLTSALSYEQNWVQGMSWYTPLGTTFSAQTASIGSAVDATNALLWVPFGQGNPNQVLHSWTYPALAGLFRRKNQFIQLQRVSVAANGATFVIDGGIGIFRQTIGQANSAGNGMCGYNLYTITNAPTFAQLRRDGGGNSATDIAGKFFTFADGDTIRLEGIINSPTSVTITALLNGVQQFSFNDDPSAFFDPTTVAGIPMITGSIITGNAGTTGSPREQWRNFQCGLL